MPKYDAAKKQEAVELMNQQGVQKTGEQLGISVQTLYKWRNEGKPTQAISADAVPISAVDMNQLLDDQMLEQKIQQLEAENVQLRAVVAQLKNALRAFIK